MKNADLDKDIAEYSQAIQLEPNSAAAYRCRGVAYGRKGDLDRAIADLSQAIRLDPELAPAHYSRGYAYLRMRDLDKAIADFAEAIRLDPSHAKAFSQRGLAYAKKGDFDQAIADLSQAIRLDPEDCLNYYNRGVSYEKKGESDKAQEDLELAKSRGYISDDRGDHLHELDALALDELLAREIQTPDDVDLLVRIGIRYVKLCQLNRAQDYYLRALQLDPNDGWTHMYLGNLNYALKRYTDAISCFSRGAELLRDVACPYWCLGDAYDAMGNYYFAEADYKNAVEVEPTCAEAIRGLEKCRERRSAQE
jgi:tetratricopeptide (TPR) repeat protein